MHPIVPILACYGMGLALLIARGGGRDPLLTSALALPVGAAASAVLAFSLLAAGLPLSPVTYGVAWGGLLGLAAWASRRQARCSWRWPAAVGAGLALVAIAASRFDVAVLSGRSHEVLIAARILAGTGELPPGSPDPGGFSVALHAAVALVSPGRLHAFAPVLGLAGLLALLVLLARLLTHPRRIPIALAAMLALVSSFPMLRSLVTVGSPAAAGIMLLCSGGIWYACEVASDSRRLPLAVLALVAFALQGPAFALAAVFCLIAVGSGTTLSRRGLAWRLAAMRAHPALRLAIASVLVCLVLALAGEAVAGALAAAPLAVFAAAALVAGRNPAADLQPGDAVSPLATRNDLRALLVSWIAGVAIASTFEWVLLVVQAGDLLSGAAQAARLLPLGLGNLLPYGLAVALLFAATDIAGRLAARRLRWGNLAVGAAVGLLAIPYVAWLARFAFSGPQAQAMAHRTLYMIVAAVAIATSFAAAIWFVGARRTRRRFAPAVIAGLAIASGGMLAASRAGLQNEYEPLHQFLGLWSLLLAVMAGRELAALLGPRLEARRRFARWLPVAAVLWSLSAGVILARDHGDAWLIWSETGASRYLTRRWSFLTPSPDLAAIGATMILKPDLETSQTAALRAERAAAPAPNIVIFSVDGLRQDRVGAYGYRRDSRSLTPNIDRFAARGVRFTRAVSSFPLTQVFNSALLLGRYVDRSSRDQQPPGYQPTAISNLLKQRDYHIFVKSWFEMSYRNRFNPRPYQFDTYVRKAGAVDVEEPMEIELGRLAAHLGEARDRGRPVFAWMHILATHWRPGKGYVPHPDFDFGDSRMDRYESSVAGTDRWLRGVEDLMASHSDRPTIWILCADHGLNENTLTRDLHGAVVRVPLVIVVPGIEPRVDDRLVDVSLDVAATVVDLAGIQPPAEYDGVSLVPILGGSPAAPMDARIVPLSYVGDWSGAIHGRFKYLRRRDVMSLYDVTGDPYDKQNLIGQEFERAYRMSAVAERELERRFRAAGEARSDGP